MLAKLICVGIIFAINLCDGAKILAVIPTSAYSHQIAFQPIWRELSLRGHQVTVLTTNPMNDPTLSNLTEIDLGFSYKVWNQIGPLLMASNNLFSFKNMSKLMAIMEEAILLQLGNPLVQSIINNKAEHFDLLMVEVEMYTPSFLAFSHRFHCPFIGIISYGGNTPAFEAIGSPIHPVLYPDIMLGVYKDLTFWERLISFFGVTSFKVFANLYYYPKEELIIKKYFGENYPPISQLMQNMDMLFLRTEPILGMVRPLTSNVIQIGGRNNVKSSEPLPADLQTILDNARNGFIYFSLGSAFKSKYIPEELRNIILETFAELPYTILWKFELDVLPKKPKNVYISKWVPQQDVLSRSKSIFGKANKNYFLEHPNIKLFITHGGLQSLEEAIYNHVPFVGIPFFADQPANIKNMVSKGITVFVDRRNITKDSFKNAIFEVIQNPKYRNNIIDLANLAKDEPMSGLQKAIWWTEYVLRHKGAKHLRSPSLDIPSYQYYLLDVLGFLFVFTTIVVYLIFKFFKLFVRLAKALFKTKKKLE